MDPGLLVCLRRAAPCLTASGDGRGERRQRHLAAWWLEDPPAPQTGHGGADLVPDVRCPRAGAAAVGRARQLGRCEDDVEAVLVRGLEQRDVHVAAPPRGQRVLDD
jgi:hypothetical protein